MRYRYEAVKAGGEAMAGEIDAASERDAFRLLVGQDMTPVRIEELRVLAAATPFVRAGRIRTRDRSLAVRELATLLQAGVPLAEAAQSIAEAHEGDGVGESFEKIHKALRAGSPLSSALRESGLDLPPFVFQLAMAGELTGKLAPGLFASAGRMEYEENLRNEIRNALIYPTILVCSGIGATLLIFIVVVPKFAAMLQHTRGDLPLLSLWVLSAGMFVQRHLAWLGLAAAAAIGAVASALARPAVRARMMESASRLPLAGTWLRETQIGSWSSMLGTLLENRVPIIPAMELAQSGIQIASVRQKLDVVLKDLRSGKKLADSLKAHRVVSPMVVNLVRVGERSGELPSMLATAAGIYETASRIRMKRLIILLEPISILLIGGAIGLIMAAIMLAITSMNNISF